MRLLHVALAAVLFGLPASAQPLTPPPPVPRIAPGLVDDGDKASLLEAASKSRAYLETLKKTTLNVSDRPVPVAKLKESLDRFMQLVELHHGTSQFDRMLRAEFDLVPARGQDGQGTVHFTAYHLPLLEASLSPDPSYPYPLYQVPDDLQRLELGSFKPSLAGESIVGRVEKGRFLPYHSRASIDSGALEGRGLEIAWLKDELARFLLMVQGSGLLKLPDGRVVNVNYAGANGRPYTSLGRLLVEAGKIPADRISVPAIREYFRVHPGELRAYLNRNESYVFFRIAEEGPFGVDGIPLTPWRSIATDKKYFPSGAIAFVVYPRALQSNGKVVGWKPSTRFMLDQDTGGAIKGPGRVDLYLGGGEEADLIAGQVNGTGQLYYLIKK